MCSAKAEVVMLSSLTAFIDKSLQHAGLQITLLSHASNYVIITRNLTCSFVVNLEGNSNSQSSSTEGFSAVL